MGVKPGKKSIGGNTSIGGGKPKTPDNTRKSLPKPAPAAPVVGVKKPAPSPTTPNMPKKNVSMEHKKPMMKGGISAQLAKVSDKSKPINKSNKKNRNKQNRGKGMEKKKPAAAAGEGQDKAGAGAPTKKISKKNRRQRLQSKMSAKPRSPLSQSRAFKAEQEMNKSSSNRVLLVKLPDQSVTNDLVKSWSSSIENAMFPKSIEPRSFLLVLKPDTNVKKEIETLKKVSFGGGKLTVEERKQTDFDAKGKEGLTPEDFIDPYTIYLTNLDDAVTRVDLQTLFPEAKTVMNPRKHNPRVTGAGTATKFAFVGFETAEAALQGFKMCFNKKFINEKFIVVRFRRVGKDEVNAAKKTTDNAAAAAVAAPVEGAGKRKAEEVSPVKKGQPLKKDDKSKLIKLEPKVELEEDSDDDDEEDDDEDDLEDSDDDDGIAFAAGKEEAGDESDDDDDDDGLDDDDDEDDDDDDDDDE